MGSSAVALVSVVALTGCTLLSLDDLNAAATTSPSDTTVGTGTSGGGAGVANGGGDPGAGAGGGTGGAEPEAYEKCILEDSPAIFLRMDSPGTIEPNLGFFLGDGVYVGPNAAAATLISTLDDEFSAKTFQSGGTLDFTTTEFTGGYQPFTIELWLRFGNSIAVAGVTRSLFHAKPASTTLMLTPRIADDGEDRLYFVIGEEDVGKRESFFFGDFIGQPNQAFHIVAVYRRTAGTVFDANLVGSDMALYVNGESVATTGNGDTTPVADVMQNLVIGGDLGTDTESPTLDEFAVYTYELSANDVARHYSAGLGGECE